MAALLARDPPEVGSLRTSPTVSSAPSTLCLEPDFEDVATTMCDMYHLVSFVVH